MAELDRDIESAEPAGKVAGIVAQFETAASLIAAASRMREEGFHRWDAHVPMPLHGLEKAMGIRMTILPWFVLGAGLAGGGLGLLMQWFTNAVHYPLIISGKPLFSLPANIPVTFELIVLFSSLTAFAGAVALNLLPQYAHPAFSSSRFARATSDGFFISVDARDAKFDQASTADLLKSLGAVAVETCREEGADRGLPGPLLLGLAGVAVLALLPPLVVAWLRGTTSDSPRIQILRGMDVQPAYRAQSRSPLFADGRSSRPAVPNTIPLGRLDDDSHLHAGKVNGAWARTFPASTPLTMETMRRGQERFNVYCAVCHGLAGDGDGMTAQRAAARGETNWVPPVQLYAAPVRSQPVGQLYHTIANGVRKMPGYRSQIPAQDRWAIVLYLQALQRSQTAGVQDIPEELRSKVP